MTKVLVHGNPEVAAIWRPLIAALAEIIDGLGHEWMIEDPTTAARGLIEFWEGSD